MKLGKYHTRIHFSNFPCRSPCTLRGLITTEPKITMHTPNGSERVHTHTASNFWTNSVTVLIRRRFLVGFVDFFTWPSRRRDCSGSSESLNGNLGNFSKLQISKRGLTTKSLEMESLRKSLVRKRLRRETLRRKTIRRKSLKKEKLRTTSLETSLR